MSRRWCFPFAAVVGQADVKEALLIALVNPKTGGVLVAGEKGSAKSVLVRSLSQLTLSERIVELPLNVTEDQVFGNIDLEQAMISGKKVFSPGLLARAQEIDNLEKQLKAQAMMVETAQSSLQRASYAYNDALARQNSLRSSA